MTILLAVLGIISLFGAVMLYQSHRRWKATAIRVTGKVVSVRRSESTSTGDDNETTITTTYYPTVKFEAEGRVVEFVSQVGSSARREVGQEIGIRYQRGNPDDAQIEGLGIKAIAALILGVAGLILIAFSVLVHR